MSPAIPQTAHELDLHLAEEIIEGAIPPVRDASRREQRDVRWIIGLLGFRGLNVTPEDVLAVMHGRPGRFRPEHSEATWVLGFRAAIDEIDRQAELGEAPDGAGIVALFAVMTKEFAKSGGDALRRELPWERIQGIDYVPAARVEERLAAFSTEAAMYAEHSGARGELVAHPVRSAAAVCREFVRLSPFRDFNLPMACLVASWSLLSAGYPPFFVHGGDRATFSELIPAPLPIWEQWFAEVVLTGYASR